MEESFNMNGLGLDKIIGVDISVVSFDLEGEYICVLADVDTIVVARKNKV